MDIDPLDVGHGARISPAEIDIRTTRSSGPGGQHANVTSSRVEASFDVAASGSLSAEQKDRVIARLGPVVRAVAQDSRSQARNRALALERLRARIEAALAVQRPRRATRPGTGARERRLAGKRRRAEIKRGRGRGRRDEDGG